MQVKVVHVPRAENSQVDALATTFQDSLDRLTPVEHLLELSVISEAEEVLPVKIQPTWINPIREYL